MVEVEPGDFVRVPIGVAFTSITTEPGRYLATVSYHRLPRVYEATRSGELLAVEEVDIRRSGVLQSTG